MKHLDLILAAMLCMGQGGLAGSRQAIYACHILAAVSQDILLLSTMAGSITVSIGQGPCHGKGSLLVLAKILHAKDGCAVLVGIKIAQGQRIAQAAVIHIRTLCGCPLGIGEDIDIRLLAIAYGLGFLVHSNIFVRHILEVQHPVVHDVFFTFRNQKMCFYHKFRI